MELKSDVIAGTAVAIKLKSYLSSAASMSGLKPWADEPHQSN